ncbi:HmuY family protein [Taibaiella soli]|uniref:HmuY protein n=1 Tax=Taibaiella soli TaxID=1649169 RepID=A0A2W2AF80_9BACT|nr:HmuY family protein [Taibaiella soli]PZF73951.1 hypothetical protein DN068_06320 [Taibaiella soli]
MKAFGSVGIVVVNICCLVFISSCLPKELPVPAHDPGNVLTASVSMDADYKWQVFYSLRSNAEISRNLKTAWDLGFEATTDGYHVVLNTSKSMFSMNTGKQDFDQVSISDTAGFSAHKHWDSPSGNLDSTAIGDWRGRQDVFVITRGFNEKGQALGFVKVQLLAADASGYTIRCGALDGSSDKTITITKDANYNLAFLSFENGITQVSVEPPKTAWDIEFTQYTHIYTDLDNMPYTVTGCLLNRYTTTAAADSTIAFDAINYDKAMTYTYTSAVNTVGFEWKTFNGTSYTVDMNHCYVVHTQNDLYYKLHFIDFYDAAGVKGAPKWEFQQL